MSKQFFMCDHLTDCYSLYIYLWLLFHVNIDDEQNWFVCYIMSYPRQLAKFNSRQFATTENVKSSFLKKKIIESSFVVNAWTRKKIWFEFEINFHRIQHLDLRNNRCFFFLVLFCRREAQGVPPFRFNHTLLIYRSCFRLKKWFESEMWMN